MATFEAFDGGLKKNICFDEEVGSEVVGARKMKWKSFLCGVILVSCMCVITYFRISSKYSAQKIHFNLVSLKVKRSNRILYILLKQAECQIIRSLPCPQYSLVWDWG